MFETRSRRGRTVVQIVVSLLVLPFVLPLVAMVQGALAGQGWHNFAVVVAVPGFARFFVNSAVIAVVTIAIVYACTMLAAFGFSKLWIRGKSIYFWMLLIVLTLPEVVLLTPLFETATTLGFYNTMWAVILPLAALQLPFTVLLTRTYVDGIPDDLLDAARIDGASTTRVFWHILLPLARPIAAAIVTLTLIGAWNEYLLPLVFLQDPSSQTITLIPSFFTGQFSEDQTKILASAVLTALPEIVAYLCLQRFFERGLSAGALK